MKYSPIILILFFASCMTTKKATSYLEDKGELPKICADKFPVKVVTDSTEYKKSKAAIDSLVKSLKNDSLISESERQALVKEIEEIRKSIKEPENCDSLSEGIYRLAAKEKRRGDVLEEKNKALAAAVNNLKPIRDTVENTARVAQLQGDVSNCIEELNKKDVRNAETAEDRDGWKKKAKQRWWIIIALLVLLFRKPLLKLIPYKIPFISK